MLEAAKQDRAYVTVQQKDEEEIFDALQSWNDANDEENMNTSKKFASGYNSYITAAKYLGSDDHHMPAVCLIIIIFIVYTPQGKCQAHGIPAWMDKIPDIETVKSAFQETYYPQVVFFVCLQSICFTRYKEKSVNQEDDASHANANPNPKD